MTVQVFEVNTLTYDAERCIGCGMCVVVCPHGVFAQNGRVVQAVRAEACIECGACERNCPTRAISVESGPGCAVALIRAALFGGEPTCGPADGCCGGESVSACCDQQPTGGCCGHEQHAGANEGCCGGDGGCCGKGQAETQGAVQSSCGCGAGTAASATSRSSKGC